MQRFSRSNPGGMDFAVRYTAVICLSNPKGSLRLLWSLQFLVEVRCFFFEISHDARNDDFRRCTWMVGHRYGAHGSGHLVIWHYVQLENQTLHSSDVSSNFTKGK